MNKFKKYCPNVWVAECDDEYEKGDIIELETKYGKTVECEVYNCIAKKDGKYFYSIVRMEEQTYAQRKAERYNRVAANHAAKSERYIEASNEGREFLSLGEPIKVGHHSEKRHRALIERNWNRMGKSVEFAEKAKEAEQKAEYWENKADEITLAMPESLEYFAEQLEKAIAYHEGLKKGSIERTHSYSLAYAKKEVNELKKKAEIAKLLWREPEEIYEINRCPACAEKAEVGLSEAVAAMKLIADKYREKVGDDGICGLCKQDADHGPGGYANECAGFYKDDCFEWRGPQEAGTVKGEK